MANQFDRYTDLDENGHDPETVEAGATDEEKTGALEHTTGCDTGWIDPEELYIMNKDGEVEGFRKADGSMASKEELGEDARRYSVNFAADTRFCHVFNHSHECKPTCFKNTEYKKPSAEDPPKQRAACRFRFGDWYRLQGGYGDAWAKRW